jgi:hypothetical protein
MNIIVDICANAAAGYIGQGKLVEAIPSLRAASLFGGNESSRINSLFLSGALADLAQTALSRGDLKDAVRHAGLSLAVTKNEAALIVLAQAYIGGDPVSLEGIARQLAEIASDDDPRGLRINALIWRLDALHQIQPRDTALEESIGRDALASINRFLERNPDAPQVLMTRAMLYRRFGSTEKALRDLRHVQKLVGSNPSLAANCVELSPDPTDAACRADFAIIASHPDNSPATLLSLYDLARRAGAREVANDFLRRLIPLDRGFQYLGDVKEALHQSEPDFALGAPGAHAKRSRIFAFAFDAASTKTLCNITLPMLLAQGNLPAWSDHSATVLEITVPSTSLPTVRQTPCLQRLATFCRIELRSIPPIPVQFERRTYGMAFEAAVGRARESNASLISLPAFVVIGNGAFATIAKLSSTGVDALLFDPLEVASAPIRGWLGDGDRTGEPLTMKASDLCEAVLRHLPRSFHRSIVDGEGKIESNPVRMLFAKADGMSVRSMKCQPFYFSATALDALSEELSDPPDGFIIDRLLACGSLRVDVIEDATAFPVALLDDGLSTDQRQNPRMAADAILEQARMTPLALGRVRLLQSKTRWTGVLSTNVDATGDAEEAAIVSAVTDRLAAL